MAETGVSPGRYCLHSRGSGETATIQVLSLAFGLASGGVVTAEEKQRLVGRQHRVPGSRPAEATSWTWAPSTA